MFAFATRAPDAPDLRTGKMVLGRIVEVAADIGATDHAQAEVTSPTAPTWVSDGVTTGKPLELRRTRTMVACRLRAWDGIPTRGSGEGQVRSVE